MWIAVVIVGVVAAVIFLALRAVSSPPSDPDPHDQPLEPGIESTELPDVGSDSTPLSPDGSPLPGSQEYRNEHGKP